MVGERVRRLRQAQGRTVTDLAASSGLSRSFVTRVESGVGNPSLESLDKLALALGVPVARLLAVGREGAPSQATGGGQSAGRLEIMRRHRRAGEAWQSEEHVSLDFLTPGSQATMELALEAGPSRADDPILMEAHAPDEFGIVLDGTYEIITTGSRQVLHEGDSVRISGNLLHHVRPIGDGQNRMIWVLATIAEP